jgi:hypothetical protein
MRSLEAGLQNWTPANANRKHLLTAACIFTAVSALLCAATATARVNNWAIAFGVLFFVGLCGAVVLKFKPR